MSCLMWYHDFAGKDTWNWQAKNPYGFAKKNLS